MYQSWALWCLTWNFCPFKRAQLWARAKSTIWPGYLPRRTRRGKVCLHPRNIEQAVGDDPWALGQCPPGAGLPRYPQGELSFLSDLPCVSTLWDMGSLSSSHCQASLPQGQHWLMPHHGIFDSPWREQSLPAQEVLTYTALHGNTYLRYFWKGE